jgi:uncharacterized damage-inducible protein DinB
MERIAPIFDNPELTMLVEYLDFHRATFLHKIDGLTREQFVSTPIASSKLSLAGLTKHLALVEDTWFSVRFAGEPDREPWASAPFDVDPDWEFRTAADDEPSALRSMYVDACERSRKAIAGATADQLSVEAIRPEKQQFSLRWVVLHMIEETSRHNGHADLLREAIDGAVGE